MDALTLLDKYGFSTAAACGAFWFIVKLVNYVLHDLKHATESLEEITIKLIEKGNEQNKAICALEQSLAELREQHRCFSGLLLGIGGRERMHQLEERKDVRD